MRSCELPWKGVEIWGGDEGERTGDDGMGGGAGPRRYDVRRNYVIVNSLRSVEC